MNRGEVWWVEAPDIGRRPHLILTRQVAIPVLSQGPRKKDWRTPAGFKLPPAIEQHIARRRSRERRCSSTGAARNRRLLRSPGAIRSVFARHLPTSHLFFRGPQVLAVPTTRTIRGIATEVRLGPEDGMPEECVLTTDNTTVVRRSHFVERITRLRAERVEAVCRALALATACSGR